MDFIDALIKKLEEAKEELSKNVNCAPGAQQNTLAKDAANPALAPKEVKVKKLQAQIDAGTYKPDPKAIADKMIKEEDLELEKTSRSMVPHSAHYTHTNDQGYHQYDIKNKDGRKIAGAEYHPKEGSPGWSGGSEKHWGSNAENHVNNQIMTHAKTLTKSELEKTVRSPITQSSPMKWQKPSVEGTSKPAKHQGGDPRHDPDNMGRKTRHGGEQNTSETSGSSDLRWGTKNDPNHSKTLVKEELTCSENGQWNLKKWNMEKRCWEGYEPTPGKEADEKGSCKPK